MALTAAAETGWERAHARRGTVLVIDDSTATRDRLARILGGAGYAVTQAPDGRHALKALITGQRVDAILLDLLMPSMDGWEFRATQLRNPRLAEIPTIIMSVKVLAEHERYSLRVGTATYVQKPFEDVQVLERLARLVDPAQRTGDAPGPRWLARDGSPLLWSRRGGVACETHAPAPGSDRWNEEGWAWIPSFAGKNKVQYACQQCEGGPIHHATRARPVNE
jgi:CheY-like chemotaxis protein